VRRTLEDLDGVGAEEPVTLLTFGDLDDDPLAGERMSNEDHDSFVTGDHEPSMTDPVRAYLVPLPDQ